MVIVAVVLLIVFIGLGITAAVYAFHVAKEKAEAALHRVTEPAGPVRRSAKPKDGDSPGQDDGVAALLGNLGSMLEDKKADDPVDDVPSIPIEDVPPCTPAPFPVQTGARIPFQEGTTITTAWGIKNGDVEGRRVLSAPTATSVDVSVKYDGYKNDYGEEQKPATYAQTICNQDFLSSNTYMTIEGERFPKIIHGLTRLRLSSKSFNEIKSTGKTYFIEASIWDPDKVLRPYYAAAVLTRVEPQDVSYPLIVNDQRVNLPVIHLAGIMEAVGKNPVPKKYRGNHSPADLYVLDDPLDPLVLLWKEQDPAYHDGKFRVEVVKVEYKTAQPVNLVEKQLTEQKRAVTYGIYFDFNKDTLKPESEPVLKEISQAMTDNPDWKLTVEGHTDNIGGDSYNLELSKRRAAAVKEALVTQYHIAPDRLANDGYGASRPVETNDTLEGRARNRRVELTRE